MTEQRCRPGEPVRADARQNRARILEVARESFTAAGDASLNSIAKKAGVGPGTLYRHFPTREELILAVYRTEVERLAADARELLAEDRPPLEALRTWFDRLAYYGRIKHGLSDVLHALADERLAGQSYELISGALAALLDACRAEGGIRADVGAEDVLVMVGFLWRTSPDGDGQARAARLLDVVIDGLRAGAPGA